jgi:hypothetical protein
VTSQPPLPAYSRSSLNWTSGFCLSRVLTRASIRCDQVLRKAIERTTQLQKEKLAVCSTGRQLASARLSAVLIG